MTPTYPATPYLRRMTRENGWQGQLVRDHQGRADVILAVRIEPTWTDAVAIESEDRCVAMRHPTHDDGPILTTGPPGTAGAVWFRDGHCGIRARAEGVVHFEQLVALMARGAGHQSREQRDIPRVSVADHHSAGKWPGTLRCVAAATRR